MTLWECLCAELCLIHLLILCLTTPWSTFCISLARLLEYLSIPCELSIYDVYEMYASLPLRTSVLGPGMFLTSVRILTSLTIFLVIFTTPKSSHRFLREENISGRNIKFRVINRGDFDTPSSSRSSKYLELINILISQSSQI